MVVTAAAVAVLTAETLATAASLLPDMAEDLDTEEGPDPYPLAGCHRIQAPPGYGCQLTEGPVMEKDMATITEVTAAE